MTEPSPATGTDAGQGGAGAMLRAARLSQGLDIGTLAATMKVPQAKLEALEEERYQALPDVAFTRALAQSICRVLKTDPAPILARLPFMNPASLERVDGGLNMPFRERGGRIDPIDWGVWRHPAFWIVVALLGAAAVIAYVPNGWFQNVARLASGREPMPAADTTVTTALPAILPASALAGGIVERAGTAVATAPPEAVTSESAVREMPASAAAASASAAEAAAQAVAHASTRIRAIEPTWVQVTDARGQILLSRLLSAGEAVGLDVEPPLRIRIGNARGTELMRSGQLVDLAASTRDNIANVELR